MSLSATASESLSINGTAFLLTPHQYGPTEIIEVDTQLPAGASGTTGPTSGTDVNIGVSNTSRLKYVAMTNAGTTGTTVTCDSGTIALKLMPGQTMVLAGPELANAFVAAWSGSTGATGTMNKLKVIAPGPEKVRLQAAIVVDAT